jgi:uncharacterized membrane protein
MIAVTGRAFFCLALIALGVEHFIFGQFVTGRPPPWPGSLPGGAAWAWLTGALFIVSGAATLIGRPHARLAALSAGALILVWALFRHLPVVMTTAPFAPEWTDAGKALTFFAGAWAVAATLPAASTGGRRLAGFVNARSGFMTLGRVGLGIFLFMTGVQHFLFTPFVASLIPSWFPGDAVGWTWFAGVCLIAGGMGLQMRWTAGWAALLSGLMVFSWFWIVHLPRTLLNTSSAIALPEALAVSGIAFVLAGSLTADSATHRPPGHLGS